MSAPDLQALQRGDAAAWDMAFPWLWPAAFGAAQVTLEWTGRKFRRGSRLKCC